MNERRTTSLRRILRAATLAIGFGTCYTVVATWLAIAVGAALGHPATPPYWDRLVVRSDGAPLIMRVQNDDRRAITYRDISGGPLDAPDNSDLVTPAYLAGGAHGGWSFDDHLVWGARLRAFVNDRSEAERWYFVHDGKPTGSGYFVAYDETSKKRLGFIGLGGFRAEPLPSSERIAVSGKVLTGAQQWSSAPMWTGFPVREPSVFKPNPRDVAPRFVYVPSGTTLREIDLSDRTVKTVFEAPAPIVAIGVPLLEAFITGATKRERPILVRTESQVFALGHDHEVKQLFTIPTSAESGGSCDWFDVATGGALLETFPIESSGVAGGTTRHVLYRLGADGTIQKRLEVDIQAGATEPLGVLELGVIAPVPAILIAAEWMGLLNGKSARDSSGTLVARFTKAWPVFAGVGLLSLVPLLVAWRRGRQFGLGRGEQLGWMAFVCLLGIPGYVGFWLHRRWPVRLACPACTTPSPRDRPDCAHCGAQFPAPALRGIEIYS